MRRLESPWALMRGAPCTTTVQADTRCTLLKLTGRASKVVNDRMLLGVTRPLGLKSPRDLCLGIGDRVRDVCPGEGLDERRFHVCLAHHPCTFHSTTFTSPHPQGSISPPPKSA